MDEHIVELQMKLAEYEALYGIQSSDVHRAIDEGRLEETFDVCVWLTDYDLLLRLEDGRNKDADP